MPKIIELYVACSWDARTHRTFMYAPDHWDQMTKEERDKFLDDQSREWAENEIEVGGIAYDSVAEIDNSRWGDSYNEEMVDDPFASKQWWEDQEKR